MSRHAKTKVCAIKISNIVASKNSFSSVARRSFLIRAMVRVVAYRCFTCLDVKVSRFEQVQVLAL